MRDEGAQSPQKNAEKKKLRLIKSNIFTNSEYRTDLIIQNVILGVIMATGVFITFFGFRQFRILMLVLGMLLVYQITFFVLVETEVLKPNSKALRIGIFFLAIFVGFFISFAAYMVEKINYIILGFAAGSQIALLFGCFFVDFHSNKEFYSFWGILLMSSLLISFFAFWKIDHTAIITSSLIGAINVSINFGIITGQFPSIEMRKKLRNDRFRDFYRVLLMVFILFLLGLLSQYFLRYRLLRKISKAESEDSIHDEVVEVDK